MSSAADRPFSIAGIVVRRASLLSAFMLFLFSPTACTSTRVANIHSADPGERILALRAAADHKDRLAVPLIVDRLEDEDEAVRFYAILALDKITGQRLGYDYAKPLEARARSVELWRQYVRGGNHAGANGEHDGQASAQPAAAGP